MPHVLDSGITIREGEKITYLYLNGISATKPLDLGNNMRLLPATSKYNRKVLDSFSKSDISYGITLLFLPLVSSQLMISSEIPEELLKLAWNSQWDAVLLGALFDCNVSSNFQSTSAAEELNDNSIVTITNYHLRGLNTSPYVLTEENNNWLEENFTTSRDLLDIPEFRHAVHCLSSYRWHTFPGAELSIIWSGIESLFKIDSEIVFRLSLYISRFLEPDNKKEREILFREVKSLYKKRSIAVHGSKPNSDLTNDVISSVKLLNRLIYKCVEIKSIPIVNNLAP